MTIVHQLLLLVLGTLFLTNQTKAVAITGPKGGVNSATGQRPFRQEISSFQNSGPAFDLYILSFQRFVQQNNTNLLSYYQVAGIHGQPYVAWDGVNGPYKTGYCTHGSILFPTWHRPYLALFEQILWNHAQDIAANYPTSIRSKYQDAAVNFRIPYWDWASNPMMPAAVNKATIKINTPTGPQTIANPLYSYTFQAQSGFPANDRLANFKTTVRYPNSAGQSQPNLVNKQLLANANSLRTLTYQLLVQQSNYASFSNTGYQDGRGGLYNSLENMHNSIHGLVGNGGHMGNVPYSAFDPIFWLHHANVDRLFAIWQAIYPNSFVTSQRNALGTFTAAPGGVENVDTALTPFHGTSPGQIYTSTTARYTKTFGYTYPEVVDWGVDSTQLSANVRTKLNALYNPKGTISKRDTNTTTTTKTNSTANHQYFVNIRVDKTALNSTSFFIHFFLGPFSDKPSTWSYDPALAGSHTIFASSSSCSLQAGSSTTVYGQIPLTHSLANAVSSGILRDLSPSEVIPLLTKSLQWRVQQFDDSAVDAKLLPSLQVNVVGQEVKPAAKQSDFPAFGEVVAYKTVTAGKAGGSGDGDGL
ncbi:hypothetical protein MMC16_000253 [Acarospora aff. strigata]|nr:hypothetical protein [Acarospora aff. strigata]